MNALSLSKYYKNVKIKKFSLIMKEKHLALHAIITYF